MFRFQVPFSVDPAEEGAADFMAAIESQGGVCPVRAVVRRGGDGHLFIVAEFTPPKAAPEISDDDFVALAAMIVDDFRDARGRHLPTRVRSGGLWLARNQYGPARLYLFLARSQRRFRHYGLGIKNFGSRSFFDLAEALRPFGIELGTDETVARVERLMPRILEYIGPES